MKRNKIAIWLLMSILFLTGSAVSVSAQDDYHWDKELVPKVIIRNPQIITKLLAALYIIESNVNFIEIYDVDQNGPSEGDLLKVNPSDQVYPLYMISAEAQVILQDIPVPVNLEKIGYTVNIRKPKTPEERILHTLAYAIKTVYSPQKPLKLYFEQDEEGKYYFQLLGYEEKDLKDRKVSFGNQQVMDLLKSLYKEISEGEPTIIHVFKTEKEIIKVPEEELKE